MASLENAEKGLWVDLSDRAGAQPAPRTLQGMIDLFGGGAKGKSALAKELARERNVKYESARRNIERYTTEKGAETRTPKQLQGALNRIAERRADQEAAAQVLARARREGVTVHFEGQVRISKDERERAFTVRLTGDQLAPFVAQAQAHHWQAAADELNYAILNAWDEGRGNITGHNGIITDVDTLDPSYGA